MVKRIISVMVYFSMIIGSLFGAIPTVKAAWDAPKAALSTIADTGKDVLEGMKPQLELYNDLMAHIEEAKAGQARGYIARLYIPDLGIDVALFRADITNKRINNGQATCDAEDSAVFDDMTYGDTTVIADHCYQGFDAISGAVPGMKGYIITGNEASPEDIQTIECTGSFTGMNDLRSAYGVPFILYNDGTCAHCQGGYTFYTCINGNSERIYINHWVNS